MRHADRPKGLLIPERLWLVVLKDGTQLGPVPATHRASARHYSKSWRDDYVGSAFHYRDVKSVRLVREQEGIPF